MKCVAHLADFTARQATIPTFVFLPLLPFIPVSSNYEQNLVHGYIVGRSKSRLKRINQILWKSELVRMFQKMRKLDKVCKE